jgi:uncharacterized protein (TIGR02145 family)
MKKRIFQYGQILFMVVILFSGCKKSDSGGTLAVIVTSVVDVVTPISAVCSGNITAVPGSSPTERGVCWSTNHDPSVTDSKTSGGTGAGEFSYVITGLTPQTDYYARAYVINNAGTAYGVEIPFTTPQDHTGETGTIQDEDGNTYHTIGIGAQYWTVENLKTTKYNDGTAIPLVTDNSAWGALVSPGFCWYDNDEATNKDTYGALYNWYTVISPKIAPAGWHVSTDAEWTILETFMGGESVAGDKLKESGTSHWIGNTPATNESGFTALPGGLRSSDGTYQHKGESDGFWTTTGASNQAAWYWAMDNGTANLTRGNNSINWGLSIRLVKD